MRVKQLTMEIHRCKKTAYQVLCILDTFLEDSEHEDTPDGVDDEVLSQVLQGNGELWLTFPQIIKCQTSIFG